MNAKLCLHTTKLTNLKTSKTEDYKTGNSNSSINIATRIMLAFLSVHVCAISNPLLS